MATHANAAARRASRSPLVINISRLGRRPGSMLTVRDGAQPVAHRTGPDRCRGGRAAEAGSADRIGVGGSAGQRNGFRADSGECVRCLTPITGEVEIDLTELFAYPNSATDETTESDEIARVGSSGRPDTVDLEQPIIDAIGLALPFSPLCGPDCAGLCPNCGVPLATAGPGHRHEQIDPRWAKLSGILEQEGDVSVDRAPLLKALGVDLPDELLTMALTHRSYSYENGGLPTNERLEFLGDAVLGLTITEELYHRHPDRSEGELAKLRASIVNTQALADVGRQLSDDGLGAHLLLGKGEEHSGGADKSSILADGVESLLGAIYVQHGITVAREVIMRLFSSLLDTAPTLGAGLDWKSSLQELTASRGMGAPSYVVTSTGPDHDKEFTASVVVTDVEYGRGVGRTKKEAELRAAAAAWNALATPGVDA